MYEQYAAVPALFAQSRQSLPMEKLIGKNNAVWKKTCLMFSKNVKQFIEFSFMIQVAK